MHPAPSHLQSMSTAELRDYRAELSAVEFQNDFTTERLGAISVILAERVYGADAADDAGRIDWTKATATDHIGRGTYEPPELDDFTDDELRAELAARRRRDAAYATWRIVHSHCDVPSGGSNGAPFDTGKVHGPEAKPFWAQYIGRGTLPPKPLVADETTPLIDHRPDEMRKPHGSGVVNPMHRPNREHSRCVVVPANVERCMWEA